MFVRSFANGFCFLRRKYHISFLFQCSWRALTACRLYSNVVSLFRLCVVCLVPTTVSYCDCVSVWKRGRLARIGALLFFFTLFFSLGVAPGRLSKIIDPPPVHAALPVCCSFPVPRYVMHHVLRVCPHSCTPRSSRTSWPRLSTSKKKKMQGAQR